MALLRSIREFLSGSSRRATASELAVLRTLLAGDDERYGKLIRQLSGAAPVERSRPTPHSVLVKPEWSYENLDFELDLDEVASDWLSVQDSASGRPLKFRVVVGRHGFLRGLEGRTADGSPWPRSWRVEPERLRTPTRPLLQLPSPAEQHALRSQALVRLGEWLRAPDEVSRAAPRLRTYPGAEEDRARLLEARTGCRLSAQYRELLALSDGLDIGDLRLLGSGDAYRLDIPATDHLVIAWDGRGSEDYVVVLSCGGSDEAVYRIAVSDRTATAVPCARGVREYIRTEVQSVAG